MDTQRIELNERQQIINELKADIQKLYEQKTAGLHPLDQEWIHMEITGDIRIYN